VTLKYTGHVFYDTQTRGNIIMLILLSDNFFTDQLILECYTVQKVMMSIRGNYLRKLILNVCLRVACIMLPNFFRYFPVSIFYFF